MTSNMLHGGDLGWAVKTYGGKQDDWLDLSTGINRNIYPFDPALALADIRELPSARDLQACLGAAREAYHCPSDVEIVAGPGTQILINSLPHILRTQRCFICEPTYSEHRGAMELADVTCDALTQAGDILKQDVPASSCMIVVNPNNPDGQLFEPKELLDFADHLAQSGSVLIVDEAFADITPEQSIIPHLKPHSNIIVLRSFGKFFGLAGVRLGFVIGSRRLVGQMKDFHGPWSVSSSALKIGTQALSDLDWQEQERALLDKWSMRLGDRLRKNGFNPCGGTSLYQLIDVGDAKGLHEHLARHHIWTRIFSYHQGWMRLGIPMNDEDHSRLDRVLDSFSSSVSTLQGSRSVR